LYSLDHFVPQGTTARKKDWIRKHRLFIGITTMGERIMTPVYIGTDPSKKTFLMDAITGSLYDIKTKRCLSSSSLRLEKVSEREGLEEILMKVKEDVWK